MQLRTWRQRLTALARDPSVRAGARECLPMALGIAAWGIVAGVAMTKSGMSIPLAVTMAILVYAGSAQVAVVPLIAAGAPMWVVWATAACVCLRFLVYSYYYRPYFMHLPRSRRIMLSYFMGDTNFAMFVRKFPQPGDGAAQQSYFIGNAVVTYTTWQVSIVIGIVAGNVIPQAWGLGFAGTMALLALACGQARSRSVAVAAGVAAVAAVLTYRLPLRLNIVVAVAAAVAVGVVAQRMAGARKERQASP